VINFLFLAERGGAGVPKLAAPLVRTWGNVPGFDFHPFAITLFLFVVVVLYHTAATCSSSSFSQWSASGPVDLALSTCVSEASVEESEAIVQGLHLLH
jgi:hypothetical protein